LDGKHKEIVDGFTADKEEQLPILQNEKREICVKLKNISLSVDERLDLCDKLSDIKNKIRAIKKKEKEYLLNNSSYVFDYFENKKKIADCANKTTLLDKFFKINTEDNELIDELGKERKNIQTYMTNVDESFLDINNFVIPTDICNFCNKGEMIAVDYEGIMICNFCSNSIRYLVENEKPSYKEPPKEVCFYAYKRINHFKEILAQFQAKETTQIPEEVLENIKLQLKKERIPLSKFTNVKAKEVLKKLDYNKYYEHIPFIKDKLGIKPPTMTPELEETLCNLLNLLFVKYYIIFATSRS
jgi:hypothetical protein